MNITVPMIHVVQSKKYEFDKFIKNIESQLGIHNVSAYQHLLGNKNNLKEVEKILKSQEGSSGLMLFAMYDHGGLLSIKGISQRARQYVIGNPLYAVRMTEHDIRAALYAPLRLLIYTKQPEEVFVEYDLPSTQFSQFANERVTEIARELDQKVYALINNSF